MKQTILHQSKKILLALLFIAVAGASCKKTNLPPGSPRTIYETISWDPSYSYLTAAVNKAGLADALNTRGKSSLTLFAPNNNAFIAAGFKTLADLKNIPDSTLKAVLLYHVLGTKVTADQIPLASNTPVITLNGQPVFVTRTSANAVFVNGVSVVKANIECTNGVIHGIDRVLLPSVGTIVETAIASPKLSLLVAAVLRASQGTTNVAAVLSGAGPFTVFAPVNDAFVKAGFPTAAAINAADPNTLTSILTYHVLSGRVFSSDLSEGLKPAMLNGETVTITLAHGAKVKGKSNAQPSNIIATDIVAGNGVVHLIDQVLLP